MGDVLTITFDGGTAAAIYDDRLAPVLEALGEVTTTRASHVEPYPGGPGWLADMGPSGGPVLGASGVLDPATLVPFATRAEALAAERAWLVRERGL